MSLVKPSLLTLTLITCLSFSACQGQTKSQTEGDYIVLYSDIEASLNYMNALGSDYSSWEGIYSYSESSYEYSLDDESHQSYKARESVNAKEIDGVCRGLDETYYTLINGLDYFWGEFYDGEAWYQNRYGTIYKNSYDKLTISYFTSVIDTLSLITTYFLNLLESSSLPGLSEQGYTLEGCVSLSSDNFTIITLDLSYQGTDLVLNGSLSLTTIYDQDYNLVYFTYTMNDLTIGKDDIRLETTLNATSYEFKDDVLVPPWLAPFYY